MNHTITEKQCHLLLESGSLTYSEAIGTAERIVQDDIRELDRYAIEFTERAFAIGLNIQQDRQRYLAAAQMVSKLYFRYQNYTKALNSLQIIESQLGEKTPDWVRLDINAAMLYSQDWIESILREPKFFLRRLDQLVGEDANTATQRSALVKSLSQIAEEQPNRVARNAKILVQSYLEKYQGTAPVGAEALAPVYTPPPPKEQNGMVKPPNDELTEAKKTIACLTRKIAALEKQNSESQKTIRRLEELVAQKDSEMTHAKAAREKNDESVESLKKHILYFTKELSDLRKTIREKEQEADDLSAKLRQSESTIYQLRAVIQTQDDEISSLKKKLSQNPLGSYLSAQSANSMILDPKRIRILVIGATRIKEDVVKAIAKTYGFGSSRITVENDYDEVKKLTSSIKPYGSSYDCIIAGPMPHSTTGKDDYNSMIAKWEHEEGYPYLIKAKSESGELKITKSSLNTAMQKAQIHFQSQGFNVA